MTNLVLCPVLPDHGDDTNVVVLLGRLTQVLNHVPGTFSDTGHQFTRLTHTNNPADVDGLLADVSKVLLGCAILLGDLARVLVIVGEVQVGFSGRLHVLVVNILVTHYPPRDVPVSVLMVVIDNGEF